MKAGRKLRDDLDPRLLSTDFARLSELLQEELERIYTEYSQRSMAWRQAYSGSITCQRGCYYCCDMPVAISLPEALVISHCISEDQYGRVSRHAQRILEVGRDRDQTAFIERYRLSVGFCPFLDAERACSIYPLRPGNCRALFSNMPSRFCRAGHWDDARPEEWTAFLRALDPDQLTCFVDPLRRIYMEVFNARRYVLGRYFNFIFWGNMHWLIYLARKSEFLHLLGSTSWASFKQGLMSLAYYQATLIYDPA